MSISFVGVGYSTRGKASWAPGAGPGDLSPYPAKDAIGLPFNQTQLGEFWAGDDTSLGSASGLNLSAYEVEVSYGTGSSLTFENVTVQIPIRPQA